MGKHPTKRRILIINHEVQLKMIGYGGASALVGVLFASLVARITTAYQMTGQEVPRNVLWAIGGCGVILFTLLTLLSMYLSNRLAGPLFRLHREIKRMSEGEAPSPIFPRKGDLYQDLIGDFNRLIERQKNKE